jgi:hypothetical protein
VGGQQRRVAGRAGPQRLAVGDLDRAGRRERAGHVVGMLLVVGWVLAVPVLELARRFR